MEGGDLNQQQQDNKKNGNNKRREVSIFANPAVWSEQAEELYARGEAPPEPETSAPAETSSAAPVGDTQEDSPSVFSMSTFSDISNSLKYAMGYADMYGDDNYSFLQQSSIESNRPPDPKEQRQGQKTAAHHHHHHSPQNHHQDQDQNTYDSSSLEQNSYKKQQQQQHGGSGGNNQDPKQQQNHPKNKRTHRKNMRSWPDFSKVTTPRTPQRSHRTQQEHLKQQQAIHSMTPKTETSHSNDESRATGDHHHHHHAMMFSGGGEDVDQRCCGIFRRAFEEEIVFRRLIHTAVAMLILFSMLSIYVIVRSSETNRANKAAIQHAPSPTLAPLRPTLIRPPSVPTPSPSQRFPTAEPTRLTAAALEAIILQAFPGAVTALYDPSSAQSRALAWLTSDDSMDAFFVTEKLIQRWALAVLFYSTNGEESWRSNDKWLTNNDECEWFTADQYTPVCDENGMVNSLHLRNNGLAGTLPDELTLLSNSLEFLYLNDGMIEGTIPSSYGKLSNLKRFYLQVNKLSGPVPSEISGMELLENLAIGRNQLTGTIPTDLVLMDELRLIDMSSNEIGGSIPTVLGKMSNLSSFLLNENKLTGTIPSEFGELPNLLSLVVQDNRLEGSVPWQVCEIKNTKTFFWLTVDCGRVKCSDECRCDCD